MPALLQAMDLQRADLRNIILNSAGPTFENTLVPLEDSGRALNRVTSILHTYTSSMNDKAVQADERDMAPILAAFENEIVQNAELFARIKEVWGMRSNGR